MTSRLFIKQDSDNAHVVGIGDHRFYFSYETCVAYESPGLKVRTAKHYSRTTTKHLSQMGVADFPALEDELFRAAVEKATALLGFNLSV